VKFAAFIAGFLLIASTLFAEPVKVNFFIYLVDLREIDGAKQTYSADVFVRLRWHDPQLSGEKTRVVPLNSVWNPNVQVINRLSVQTTLPDVLEIDSSGNVMYRQRFIGQFSCNLDLRRFPFDQQNLLVSFVALGQTPDRVQFIQDPQKGGVGNLAITDWKIGPWKTKSSEFQIIPGTPPLSGFTFEIGAERRFYYFLVQIILPMTLIVGMSWIVFWLDPTQTGPRVSTSITSMLTLVAYRFLTGSFLPRLPYLTRLDAFVFGCTLLVFCSLIMVIWIGRLFLAKQDSKGISLNNRSRWLFPSLFLVMLLACFLS
jgi:neurotransmitter-gated ion-channel